VIDRDIHILRFVTGASVVDYGVDDALDRWNGRLKNIKEAAQGRYQQERIRTVEYWEADPFWTGQELASAVTLAKVDFVIFIAANHLSSQLGREGSFI